MYDSDGWCCANVIRLASSSGRASHGDASGVGAADRDVVAAAGAGHAAVEQVALGGEPGRERGVEHRRVRARRPRGRSYAGGRLTSSTPGSGVTAKRRSFGDGGGA